jgi:hypothetical protein
VTDQNNTPTLDALEAALDEALVRTFGADTLDYQRYKSAAEFDRGPYNYAYKVPPQQRHLYRGQRTVLLRCSLKQ